MSETSDPARTALRTGAQVAKGCDHLAGTADVRPQSNGCEECLRTGESWVELRLCQSCGNVACCDSSVGKHATAHFTAASHPIATSFDNGEDWGWCYADQLLLMPFGALQERVRAQLS